MDPDAQEQPSPPSPFLSLPDYLLFVISSFLDVHSSVQFSRVNKRIWKVCGDQRLWFDFCAEACHPHIPLLKDICSPNYKLIYKSMYKLNADQIKWQLMFSWIQKRINLTIRDPHFLLLNVHLFAGQNSPNQIKQTLFADKKEYEKYTGKYNLSFKMHPNQLPVPVFFYGERGITSSCDLVAIGRSLEPREIKVISHCPIYQRAPRNSGFHFVGHGANGNAQVRVRISPLSSIQAGKLGLATTMQRTVGTDHSHARSENMSSDTTNWRLQTSASVPDYKVGELENLTLEIHIESLFNTLCPSYLSSLESE
eukprot:Phypoly_transcript_14682.p1 GENE.Phypoly_transcript_14682~~Phypoly_transcript_14682.p1  ORF type:complete len:310 (+),score=47.79 Phypoly_transcript_14682:3-932(+)